MLRCKVCFVEKDRETSFYRTRGHICKECVKENKRTDSKDGSITTNTSIDVINSTFASISISSTKICNTCKVAKSPNDFYAGRRTCKKCHNKRCAANKKFLPIKAEEPISDIDSENDSLYKFVSQYIKDDKNCRNCVAELRSIFVHIDKYIFALNAENYPEGFTRSSIVSYHNVVMMSIISSRLSKNINFSLLPTNYHDYVIEFYLRHKDKYSLKYPELHDRYKCESSMFY